MFIHLTEEINQTEEQIEVESTGNQNLAINIHFHHGCNLFKFNSLRMFSHAVHFSSRFLVLLCIVSIYL